MAFSWMDQGCRRDWGPDCSFPMCLRLSVCEMGSAGTHFPDSLGQVQMQPWVQVGAKEHLLHGVSSSHMPTAPPNPWALFLDLIVSQTPHQDPPCWAHLLWPRGPESPWLFRAHEAQSSSGLFTLPRSFFPNEGWLIALSRSLLHITSSEKPSLAAPPTVIRWVRMTLSSPTP